MTTLDLSPAPAPAPPLKRIIRHGLIEARLLIRNGEQLLLALVIPLAILVAGRFASASIGSLEVLGPSVLALAVWSSAFTSVAISTAFERRYGVLERLATTPLGKPGLLGGKALAVILILAGQLVILAGAALGFGWRPEFTPQSALLAVVLVILATATFVCLALLLAGRLRAESTLPAAGPAATATPVAATRRRCSRACSGPRSAPAPRTSPTSGCSWSDPWLVAPP